MPTREAALDWYRHQIGTVEHGGPHGNDGNVVHFWDDIHHHEKQGCAWCDAFVEAGELAVGVPVIIDSQYCPTVMDAYRKAGRLTTIEHALPGDQIFWHFHGEHAGANHTSVLEALDLAHHAVTDIEGNTSPGVHGSQANGGGVYRRTRSTADIIGVGQPVYDPAAPIAAVTSTGKPLIGAFSTGPYVRLWKQLLNDKASMHVTVDDHFDAATVDATKAFQRMAHIKDDGIVYENSWTTMLALKA